MTQRIIVAEQEAGVAAQIIDGLDLAGFECTAVSDGNAALQLAMAGQHDLMVLDAGLPLIDGFGVLNLLRQAGVGLPVIVLDRRASVEDTVSGLDAGADDYLTKPFAFPELLARINLRLGGRRRVPGPAPERCGLRLDHSSRAVHGIGAEAIGLSSREYALLDLFLRHPGQVLTRDQLLGGVWADDRDSNIVSVYVQYLRRKLGVDAIETVRGLGYRLAVERVGAERPSGYAADSHSA